MTLVSTWSSGSTGDHVRNLVLPPPGDRTGPLEDRESENSHPPWQEGGLGC